MRPTAACLAVALLATGLLVGCDKGPAQKAGEKIDKAVDQLTGKGPVEKVGEKIDKAVGELKK